MPVIGSLSYTHSAANTMASLFLSYPERYVRRLCSVLRRPVPVGWTLLASVGAGSAFYVMWDAYDYFFCTPLNARGIYSHNPVVYFFSGLVRLYRSGRGMDGTETKALVVFVNHAKDSIWRKRFLKAGDLAIRRGPRPTIVRNGLPHRQVAQILDSELQAAMEGILSTYADQNPDRVYGGPSIIEGQAPALLLAPGIGKSHPDTQGRVPGRREIAHVHRSDNSMHMCLAPLDAVEAIEKGWGLRFPLAGSLYPQGQVMVYAPRDMGEVETVRILAGASLAWMTSEP